MSKKKDFTEALAKYSIRHEKTDLSYLNFWFNPHKFNSYKFKYDDIYKIKSAIEYGTKCIYIIYVNNKPVYVGQSRNVHNRIRTHGSRLLFDYVEIIIYPFYSQEGLNREEMEWIDKLNPPLNWVFVPFENSHSGIPPMKYEDVLNWCNNYYYREAV